MCIILAEFSGQFDGFTPAACVRDFLGEPQLFGSDFQLVGSDPHLPSGISGSNKNPNS
jgi:hypothetical protein